MEPLNVIEHIAACVGKSAITPTVDALALSEEALGSGVVPTMADVAHAADDSVIYEELLILSTGELCAAVRVQDYLTAIRALPAGHHHRLKHQMPILHRCYRHPTTLPEYRSSTAHR